MNIKPVEADSADLLIHILQMTDFVTLTPLSPNHMLGLSFITLPC